MIAPPYKVNDPTRPGIIEIGLTAPAEALALARSAHSDSQDSSPHRRARAALALGFALNRAEHYAEALPLLTETEPAFSPPALAPEAALCQWQIGVAARFLRSDARFDQILQTALESLQAAGLDVEAARCRRDLAAAHNWKGRYDESAAQTAQARAFFEQRGLAADAAQCVFAESARLRWESKFEQAAALLLEAESIFQRLGLPVERETARLYQGSVYVACMDLERALPCLQQAQAEFERLDLPMRLALCRLELGLLALYSSRLKEAERHYELAADSFRSLRLRSDFAMTLMSLASVRYYGGQLNEALGSFRQARTHFHATENNLYDALCEMNIGACHSAGGRYGLALRHLDRARAGMEQLRAPDHVAHAQYNIGKTWLALGDAERAADHLARAADVFTANGALFPAARSLVHLALAEARLNRADDSLAHLSDARRQCIQAGARGYVAVCDQVAGQIQARAGQHAEAVPLLQTAQNTFAELGMTISALACAVGIADSQLALGDRARAAETFQSAYASIASSLPDLAWRCAAGLARIAEDQNRVDEALTWHGRVVALMKGSRAALDHEILVDSFLAGRGQALNRAIRCAVETGQFETALAFAEDSRAQLLAGRLSLNHRPPDQQDDKLRSLRLELAELRRRSSVGLDSRASFIRPPDGDGRAALEALERKGREYHERAALTGANENPGAPPFNLENLRRQLASAAPGGWTCFVYHWLDDQLLIFTLTAAGVHLCRRRLSPLDDLALDLCAAPPPDRRRMIYGTAAGRPHLKRLLGLLLPESFDPPSPNHLIVIIPAGRLHSLPFHALADEQSALCQRATLAYAPSLATLSVCLSRADGRPAQTASALVVAVEHFGDAATPLPCSVREAEIVGGYFRSQLFVNTAATVENVLRQFDGRHDVLHFATHAIFDTQFGRLSRILLHDGDLQADEIEEADITARLVTLSACH
ncbi:MAG: CHAT domain-containing tetratricopeptide repeat protein, partial [Chloroflexota bacterium]